MLFRELLFLAKLVFLLQEIFHPSILLNHLLIQKIQLLLLSPLLLLLVPVVDHERNFVLLY